MKPIILEHQRQLPKDRAYYCYFSQEPNSAVNEYRLKHGREPKAVYAIEYAYRTDTFILAEVD